MSDFDFKISSWTCAVRNDFVVDGTTLVYDATTLEDNGTTLEYDSMTLGYDVSFDTTLKG